MSGAEPAPRTGPLDDAARRIVVVGSINADLVARVSRHPRPGETLTGAGGDVLPGGKGANQAVAAARLGGDVAMVGAVGEDAHAEAALRILRASGVDLAAVREVPGPTGLALVTVADDGENSIIVIPGANATLDAEAVSRHRDLIAAASVVVLQGEIPRSGIERAARLATGRLILNPAPVLDLDADVLRRADPLVVNEHEAALVLAQLTTSPAPHAGTTADPGDGERTPVELVLALREAGVPAVVLTLGARGALIGDARREQPLPLPAVAVRAVDTTGAGDAFTGALALRLADGEDLADAARFATRVSAASVTAPGAQPSYPSHGDALPGA